MPSVGKQALNFIGNLGKSLLTAGATAAAMWALQLAITAISNAINSEAIAIEELDKKTAQYEQTKSDLASAESEQVEVRSRLTELNNIESKSIADESETQELRLQNAELTRKIQLLKDQAEIDAGEVDKASKKVWEESNKAGIKTSYDSSGKKLSWWESIAANINRMDEAYSPGYTNTTVLNRVEAATSAMEKYNAEYAEYSSLASKVTDGTATESQLDRFTALEESLATTKKYIIEIKTELGKSNESGAKSMIDQLTFSTGTFEEKVAVFGGAISETIGSSAQEDLIALANAGTLTAESLDGLISDEALNRLNELTGGTEQTIDFIKLLARQAEDVGSLVASVGTNLGASYNTAKDNTAKLQTQITALSNAQKQFSENGYFTVDTLNALTDAGINYRDAIDSTNGTYSISIEKMQESFAESVNLERSLNKLREETELKTLADLEASGASEDEIQASTEKIALYKELDAELLSLISSMSDYKAAIETANASSDFDYATSTMLGTITDGLKSGRVATDEFKAAMSYFTDGQFANSFTQENIPAMQEFFDTISKYTQGGATGLNAAYDAFSAKDLLDDNGMFRDEVTLEMAAQALGTNVGTQFTYSLLKSYEDYGFDLNLEEIMQPEDWEMVTQQVLKTADGYTEVADKIKVLNDQLAVTEDATEKSRLTDQIKNLTDSLSADELTAVINNLQTLQDSGKADVQPVIDDLNALKTLKANIDSTVLTTLSVDDKASAIIASVNAAYESIPRLITTVITTDDQTGSDGSSEASPDVVKYGKVSGNANAGGQWGDGTSGKTLVGELGRELVVNPHTNRWYTVGDRGAQFVNLPKDAIVFNHVQTEGILGNGSIFGRGKAMLSGNAAVSKEKEAWLTSMYVDGGIGLISTDEPTKDPGDKKKVVAEEAKISELYEKENKLLEHQANLLEDMINLHEVGSDEWFSQQQNIIDTYKKSAELAEAEYWRLHALSNGVITDDMQSLMEDLIKYKKEVFDASKEYWEAEKDNAKKTLDYLKNQAQAVVDLKTSYHDLTKSLQAEQREIDTQLKIAADVIPNLTEAERAAIFSGDDYQALSNQLSAISAEAQDMYTSYLEQIQSVGEGASYELETITDEFERQYSLKMDQYNIAKAELGVLKARKNLENVQNERSVAMLVGGLWTWVSDSDNVISAMEDLASAETELADAQSDASFNADTANWEGYISSIDNQIGAIDELVYTMDDLADEIHSLVDSVETQIQTALSASTLSLFSALPNYSGTSTSLFSTTSLQNLWTASVSNAIASAGSSITTSDLIGELLSNMSNYVSTSGTSTTNGDVLMWNGNVVASGSDVTLLISMLRSLIPLMPVTT